MCIEFTIVKAQSMSSDCRVFIFSLIFLYVYTYIYIIKIVVQNFDLLYAFLAFPFCTESIQIWITVHASSKQQYTFN